jgi:hypothetical protein
MNKIQRENELKMRVWNDTIKDSLVQVYGEENVLEVEPFTFCVPELDYEGNETCLKIKLSTPRKNADGEEYDMYEEASAYKATLEAKREDDQRKREKKEREEKEKEARKEARARKRKAEADKVLKNTKA